MDSRIEVLHASVSLHTRLFLNCLAGVDDETAVCRPSTNTNSLAFIACHLVDARAFLARLVGAEAPAPFPQLENARHIDEVSELPPLAEIQSPWSDYGDLVSARFEVLDAEELDSETPQQFPIGNRTLLGAVAFLVSHEAYHIGQMALLRKYAGLEAMRYT